MRFRSLAPEPMIALVAAFAYALVDLGLTRTPVKMIPALVLSEYAVRRLGTRGVLIAAGLAWHSLGDGLLDLGGGMFLAGLGAFLIGHLFYATAFARRRAAAGDPSMLRSAAAIGVAVATGVVLLAILPGLHWPLTAAVPAYSVSLGGMVVLALLAGWRRPWVATGAVLFLISDACLGLRLFGPERFHAAGVVVWPTYAAAQLLIATGYVAEARDDL